MSASRRGGCLLAVEILLSEAAGHVAEHAALAHAQRTKRPRRRATSARTLLRKLTARTGATH